MKELADETARRGAEYAAEIRGWLAGRLSTSRSTGAIASPRHDPLKRLALNWWIFEGRRYQGLDRRLAWSFREVERQARRLLVTYNPAWRHVEVPEGETDYLASAMASVTSNRPIFVSRAAHQGLNDNQRQALLGWMEWIRARWCDHVGNIGTPQGAVEEVTWQAREEYAAPEIATLRRWAHTARRSRWPLLRNVVAESLRCALEPQELDQLPLPKKHDALFELLCLVRILRGFQPNPGGIRWVDQRVEKGSVQIPGIEYEYQYTLPVEDVTSTPLFDGGLREAQALFKPRVHRHMDGWTRFDRPRNGFVGLVVEMKSGKQGLATAVFQLKCYREALRRRSPGPMLVWGIFERPEGEEVFDQVAERLIGKVESPAERDVWVFSTADEIPRVVEGLKLTD